MLTKNFIKCFCFLLLLFCINNDTNAQPKTKKIREQVRILFLIDFSGSMLQTWAQLNKLSVAKDVLNEIVDSLSQFDNLQLGLRAYGHQSLTLYSDCFDTKLEVPFGYNNSSTIKKRLEKLEAKGITPIAYALEQSAKDFPDFYGKNYIIFISDGEESCKGDPCAVAKALMDKGVNLKLFVIGLSLGQRAEASMQCIGQFYNSKNPYDFKKIITSIVTNILYTTTMQVDLNSESNKPTETNVAMTFNDAKNKSGNVYYYHTMNVRGNPDTFRVPPLSEYNLTVHTTPPLSISNFQIVNEKHNTINVDAAQGDLELKLNSTTNFNNINNKLKAVIRDLNNEGTIEVQYINEKKKYLEGNYYVEILTLPRIILPNVRIDGSKTTTIQVPTPGLVSIFKPYELIGAIYHKQENGQLSKIMELQELAGKETVALQEGNYAIVYRSKKINKTMKTLQKEFKVGSGAGVNINL